ncbi:futalosine hydrolase [Chitinophaga costaii]|uniref:Futalosine hydrolase n=2 Tax=Chitinophaga costaii TaxID=1335309 RepID=A0A1C4BVD0_9BACT|nr:futalosine hydrolase [Chitinophaga costaii]
MLNFRKNTTFGPISLKPVWRAGKKLQLRDSSIGEYRTKDYFYIMKLAIVAATRLEIQPFITQLSAIATPLGADVFQWNGHTVTIWITGIGPMHTAFTLGQRLPAWQPDFAVQAGIAGTFRHDWELGSVVAIRREVSGDLGAEDNGQFLDLFEIGLCQPGEPPYQGKYLVNGFTGWPSPPAWPLATGVTVNTVSGSVSTISRLEARYQPEIESMEGAAFHYACLVEKVPFLQLRCISNYVEVRDKSKWEIGLAVKNLNNALLQLIQSMVVENTNAITAN